MPRQKPYRLHLSGSDDLITTYEKTRAGFIALALEKNRRATPTIAEARALKAAASQAKNASGLLNIDGIKRALLTAAGVSDKAANFMLEEDKTEAIKEVIKNFLEPAGPDFVEELVYRFLLTKGDALGGSIRNLGGLMALRKLTRSIIATLNIAGISYKWLHSKSNEWITFTGNDEGIELHLKGINWSKGDIKRTLIYNIKPSFVGKNVDLCLFNCSSQELQFSTYQNPAIYVALGELKGGIDPAGADERWKTAKSAINQIRKGFSEYGMSPTTFFIGASITRNMALEIWQQLENGTLSNAANFTEENQVAAICRWICNL